VSELQDVLEHELRGLALYTKDGAGAEANAFVVDSLFSTLTNVNFDDRSFEDMVRRCVALREGIAGGSSVQLPDGAEFLSGTPDRAAMEACKERAGIRRLSDNEDIRSLMHTVMYGLKGVAAYAYHARTLGQEDESVYAFFHEALAAMLDKSLTLDDWVKLALRCGEVNLKVMEILDAGNTGTYGHPEPTKVSLGQKKGKAILVSGHDLMDLDEILRQTEGKGINVYTHGEMLPCHGYPGLKKYSHLAGHYGTAWQNQKKEFAAFPGAIVMTTNCIQKPAESYMDSIFTSGPVQWPGTVHIEGHDFGPVIEKALELPGFEADAEGKTVMTGFARNAVLGVADKVIEGVKNKDIRHFFLVAGCDGAKPGRNYYTEFVERVPKDCVVLTLACGKFRFFDKDLGDIGGIPRLLDVGQCNDAYSAIKIAVALSEAFGVGVNELPLSLVISWYEQKAVSILLSLLHLGIKDIRLGPTLPAFITPNVLQVLVDNYDIKPITTAENDLNAILCPGGDVECIKKLAA
jgi:hydroxylamine reductase